MTLWLSIWWEKKKNSSPFPPRRIQLNCSASAIFRWYDRWWLVLKVAAVKGGAGMEYWWLFWGEWGAPTEQGLTVDPGKYWTDCMRRNSYNETWNINISLFSCRFAVSFFPFSVLLGGGSSRRPHGRKRLKLSGRLLCWTLLRVIHFLITVTVISAWQFFPVFLF